MDSPMDGRGLFSQLESHGIQWNPQVLPLHDNSFPVAGEHRERHLFGPRNFEDICTLLVEIFQELPPPPAWGNVAPKHGGFCHALPSKKDHFGMRVSQCFAVAFLDICGSLPALLHSSPAHKALEAERAIASKKIGCRHSSEPINCRALEVIQSLCLFCIIKQLNAITRLENTCKLKHLTRDVLFLILSLSGHIMFIY